MMHRCSSSSCSSSSCSQGNLMGHCTCGLFHPQTNSFTMLFSMPNSHHNSFEETDMYPFPSSSSSSSVDCTLSLGTPSTRLTENRPSSCTSDLCWDMLQTKHTPYNGSSQTHKSSRGTNSSGSHHNSANNDPLLARRCANCDTTSTPLWRNGPRGPKSLCNACGIRFKKEERRATAANASSNNINGSGGTSSSSSSSGTMEHYGYQTQKMPWFSSSNNEFRFIEESDRDSHGTSIPFLSWRLNVTDRPGLVHDFTR